MEQEVFNQEPWSWAASQEVEGLSSLVHQFPKFTFHIAALTMGPEINDLETCSNVHLYQSFAGEYEDLLASEPFIWIVIRKKCGALAFMLS